MENTDDIMNTDEKGNNPAAETDSDTAVTGENGTEEETAGKENDGYAEAGNTDNEEQPCDGEEAGDEKSEAGGEEADGEKDETADSAKEKTELTADQKRIMSAAAVIAVFVTALVLVAVFSFAGRTAASKNVIKLISSVGTVTADSGETLRQIEEAYDNLSPSEKNSVSNYGAFLNYCKKYETIMNEETDKRRIADNALIIVGRLSQQQLTGDEANFPELYEEAQKLLKEKSISDETKEALNNAIATIDSYNAFAQECAACYVKAFNRIYKSDSRTVTSVGCIISIVDGKQENLYALTYTQGDTQGTVYAHATVSSEKSTNKIVSNPDLFFADTPVSDDYDAMINSNTTINPELLNLSAEE